MKREQLDIPVPDAPGQVSAEWMKPRDAHTVYVFAHGAGAPKSHAFMVGLSSALAGRGVATLRFNFPYMERGSRRPDSPAVAQRAIVSAITTAVRLAPGLPIVAGGKSFGGRMASQMLSGSSIPEVVGLVFVGFPLHPAGKPATDRAAHLRDVTVPMLFLQGTRDALAHQSLIEEVCRALPLATLHLFEGADHSFKAGKRDLLPELADRIEAWCNALVSFKK